MFIKVETMMNDLFDEILPGIRRINIVDDSLLPDVIHAGKIEPAVEARMELCVRAAERTGADVIFSLCSSLGPAVDKAKALVHVPVLKIDEAMAVEAVKRGRRIAVMATVPTTLGPTVDMVRSKAEAGAVEVRPVLVEGAFDKLMCGLKSEHDTQVLDCAARLAGSADVIVFAQASMTRLAEAASKCSQIPVLTSPRLGIENLKALLESLS